MNLMLIALAPMKDTRGELTISCSSSCSFASALDCIPGTYRPLYQLGVFLKCAHWSSRYGTSAAHAMIFQRSFSFVHSSRNGGDSSSPKLSWLSER